jgi:predicted DNA-binding transcriptional regulator YafY
MKAQRLLSALLLLQAHGQLSGRALAGRLEVSQRTIHRDMEALSASGVPVFATRGAGGGWQLDEGWRTRVPALDEGELQALLMAQPRAIGDSRLALSAERALTKLMAALPVALREQAASIRQRLFVDPTGWRGTVENLSMLPIVQEGVTRGRMLKLRYRPSGRAAERRIVHPLGLVAKGTTWYLVANTPNGLRTFRVSRMEEASVLDRDCDRPVDFDLAAYWRSSTDELRNRQRYIATLRVEAGAAEGIRTWCRATPVERRPHDPEGWATLRVQFEGEDDACFVVLGLGRRVDVMEPASLRERVASEAAATFARLQR